MDSLISVDQSVLSAIGVSNLHNFEFEYSSGSAVTETAFKRNQLKRFNRGPPLFYLVGIVSIVSVVFLLLQCFRFISKTRRQSTLRRLAGDNRTPECDVSAPSDPDESNTNNTEDSTETNDDNTETSDDAPGAVGGVPETSQQETDTTVPSSILTEAQESGHISTQKGPAVSLDTVKSGGGGGLLAAIARRREQFQQDMIRAATEPSTPSTPTTTPSETTGISSPPTTKPPVPPKPKILPPKPSLKLELGKVDISTKQSTSPTGERSPPAVQSTKSPTSPKSKPLIPPKPKVHPGISYRGDKTGVGSSPTFELSELLKLPEKERLKMIMQAGKTKPATAPKPQLVSPDSTRFAGGQNVDLFTPKRTPQHRTKSDSEARKLEKQYFGIDRDSLEYKERLVKYKHVKELIALAKSKVTTIGSFDADNNFDPNDDWTDDDVFE